MQVSIGEDNEAAVLGAGVSPGLLLSYQRLLLFRLGLQHDERESPLVQKKVVDEPPAGLLKVIPKSIQVRQLERNTRLNLNVGWSVPFREEAPGRVLQQSVDL